MIKIEISVDNVGRHFNGNQYWGYCALVTHINKPYSINEECKWFLNDKLHSWMLEQNIVYSVREKRNTGNTIIIFKKSSDAVLFKLVWM